MIKNNHDYSNHNHNYDDEFDTEKPSSGFWGHSVTALGQLGHVI